MKKKMLNILFKKKTPLQKENLQFEKQFVNASLLKAIKKMARIERKQFAIACLSNALKVRYSNDEIYLKLMRVYELILNDEKLNKKENYECITPKLIEREDIKWYTKERNSLSLSINDLNQFSQFFFMLPIDMATLFKQVEIIMLTSVKEEEYNALYKLLHYMEVEAVLYPIFTINTN